MSYLQDADRDPDSRRAQERRQDEDWSFCVVWSIIIIYCIHHWLT